MCSNFIVLKTCLSYLDGIKNGHGSFHLPQYLVKITKDLVSWKDTQKVFSI